MMPGQIPLAAGSEGGTSPFFYAFLALFFVMGVVQVVRPQLLWRLNRPLQKPFVKDYDATEPNARGYAIQRVVGVVFLIVVGFLFVNALT
ncbi:DUF6199 family natural product biosynthesis protein [Streptomyces sp. NPDC046887]|uniref:DUF6199 family natural product biosynthesis protein n=1 Tax=Streptomyces sp. NPDC046887 TaxID=3155472 RepID=UPI0033E150A4